MSPTHAKGEAVRALQNRLNALGYNAGSADGSFGPRTEAAVKAFQKARGLTTDGVVGRAANIPPPGAC